MTPSSTETCSPHRIGELGRDGEFQRVQVAIEPGVVSCSPGRSSALTAIAPANSL